MGIADADYELFINCGGRSLTYGDRVYEEDSVPRGTAAFYSTENWAHSSTGNFIGGIGALYVVRNTPVINSYDTTELYATARTAPLSLKYYGLCLQEGNYTVGLHFAEIIFTNHSAYSSVGQRRFDVYIQVTDMLHISLDTKDLRLFMPCLVCCFSVSECRKLLF